MTSGERPLWIIRTYAGFGGAEETNRRFHENLKSGQKGLSIAFDLPTQNGYDPDAAMALGEVGKTGVSIAHLGDMETLLRGINTAEVNTSMTINATAPYLLALYLVLAERQNVPWEKLRGTTQNDMLKEFVARGTSIFSPEVSLKLSTDLIAFTAEHVPQWNPVNVCGYHYMESGAGPHEEIGYALANAMLLLDTLRPRLKPERFESVVRRISFFINSGIELVPELCKVRAYSKLWTRLCASEYGIPDVPFRAGCQVRSLTLTAEQPENNIIRIALQALPVLLSANARVHALQLPGFREALALPDAMEQRLSLRTQQIIMHEMRLGEYGDIFDGNPVIEETTEQIMADALAVATELRAGGYSRAIESINNSLTRAMMERKRRVESGEDVVVGVNAYTESVGLSEQIGKPVAPSQDSAFEQHRATNLSYWRSRRDAISWRVAKERVEAASQNGANIMYPTLEFVRAGGTVGEWTSIIELATSGRYSVPLNLQSIGTSHPHAHSSSGLRIILGKAGLDGHTNAIKLLAIACRNAGMEVIFSGIKQSPATLIKAAIEEDADVLGVSCLSGAHLKVAEDLLALRSKLELSSLKIVMGGIIPPDDQQKMMLMGIDLVVADPSTSTQAIVEKIRNMALSRM